jgi:Cu/Ag efflux pump CusA
LVASGGCTPSTTSARTVIAMSRLRRHKIGSSWVYSIWASASIWSTRITAFRMIIPATALAAILAMIPLSRSAFWAPMAITIMGGLFVATFLTLLFLPSLYALWYRKRLGERGDEVDKVAPATERTQRPVPIAIAAE